MIDESLANGTGAPRNEPLYPRGKGAGRAAGPSPVPAAPAPSPAPAPRPADEAGQPASLLGRLAARDQARPGFPGEHWVVLGLGVALLIYASRRGARSPLLSSLATTAGTGLIARAASGRDGLRGLIQP